MVGKLIVAMIQSCGTYEASESYLIYDFEEVRSVHIVFFVKRACLFGKLNNNNEIQFCKGSFSAVHRIFLVHDFKQLDHIRSFRWNFLFTYVAF